MNANTNDGAYCTISIKKELKDKLNSLKGSDSYSNAIDKLLQAQGGLVNDLDTIGRGKVALTLKSYFGGSLYVGCGGDSLDITFKDLQNSTVGDIFYVDHVEYDNHCWNETARVIFKDDDTVVLRIKTNQWYDGDCTVDYDLVQVALF